MSEFEDVWIEKESDMIDDHDDDSEDFDIVIQIGSWGFDTEHGREKNKKEDWRGTTIRDRRDMSASRHVLVR